MTDLIGSKAIHHRFAQMRTIILMLASSLILCSFVLLAIADAPPSIDYSTLSEWKSVNTRTPVTSVAFSPDQSMVAGGLDGKIEVYNDKLEPVQELKASENKEPSADVSPLDIPATQHRWMMALAFSPDNKLLAAACYDGTVRIWDIKTGAETTCKDPKLSQDEWTVRSHNGLIRSIAFSPDGAKIVSGGDDKAVKLWEVKTGKLLWNSEEHIFPVGAIAFSVDGNSISSIGAKGKGRDGIGEFKIWDANTGQLKQSVTVNGFSPKGAVISPDGKVAMVDIPTGFWDFKTGVAHKIDAFADFSAAGWSHDIINGFSPDSTIVVSVELIDMHREYRSTIKVLNVQNGQSLIRINVNYGVYIPYIFIRAYVSAIAVTKDNRSIVFGCRDGSIRIWSVP